MASPRRHSTLIELIRDRPTSVGNTAPVRVDRVKPDKATGDRAPRSGGFDVATAAKWFSAGRRLNLPMGYVFIAVALVFASWIGMYMIGYSKAAGVSEADHIARLTSTADPLLTDANPAATVNEPYTPRRAGPARTQTARPTPQVSSTGPTGTGLPIRRSDSVSMTATANRPASVLPTPEFDPDLNYWIIANYHEDQARQAALFLIDNGIPATVIRPTSRTAWQVVGLTGFSREAYRAGEHHEYVNKLERLGATWEKEFKGPDNFGQMYPVKGQNLLKNQ